MRIFIILMVISLSGCEMIGEIWKPEAYDVMDHGKRSYTSDVHKKAYLDGCESGQKSYGNDLYKAFYQFKYDSKMAKESPKYKRIWRDSYNYCRHYTGRHLRHGLFAIDDPDTSNSLLGQGVFNNANTRSEPETKSEWQLIPKAWDFHGETDMWGSMGQALTATDKLDTFQKQNDSFFSQGMGTGDFGFLGQTISQDGSMF